MKLRLGFFDFTGCEGCQLTLLTLGSEIVDLLNYVDIVECREFSSATGDYLDVAFIEGSVTTEHEIDRLRSIRERSIKLVAVGACSDIAGVHALGYRFTPEELSKEVYGNDRFESLGHPQPIDAIVQVDYRLSGCPPNQQEFLDLVQSLRLHREPEELLHPVCVDCKLKEYPCLFEDGIVCLGPVTKGGCDAICIGNGDRCRGCRGEVANPRSNPYRKILTDAGLSISEIAAEYRAFNLAAIRKSKEEE